MDDMLTCTLLGPCTKPETSNEPDPNCARTEEDVQPQLTRRRPGQSSLTTARRGLCCWVWQEGTPQHQETKRNIAHDSVKEISKHYKVTRNQAAWQKTNSSMLQVSWLFIAAQLLQPKPRSGLRVVPTDVVGGHACSSHAKYFTNFGCLRAV